jgi:hypothetical protein
VPPIAVIGFPARQSPRLFALLAAVVFAALIASKGIPTLRHDWTWPIDRTAIPSFLSSSIDGWLSAGLGTPNPHPTTYLIALPIAAAMWLLGPLGALILLALVIGYACMRCVAAACAYWSTTIFGAVGIGLFALFNPWVYNEVVAGHLVMVLAYAGLIGLFAEMLHGRNASTVRLALWTAMIEAQLQFFILAMLALIVFASTTRKWMPPVFGAIVALPSVIGLLAERGTLLRIPYGVTWQANQSVPPIPLLSLGGYFPGYADRLGLVAAIAVWTVLALALVGFVRARRHEAVIWSFTVAVIVYIIVLGVHGPLAIPYTWLVRNVPESGVFRELYDLAGAFAAFLALLASVATGRVRTLGYAALAAGIALALTWLVRPPGDLWVASTRYPHPQIAASPFTRVALLPAFQPLALRGDGGDGADPDAFVYPHQVPALNEYFPSYPVDMALARYEQSGDVEALRALGVGEIVPRPWLVSRTHGEIGFAATSLAPKFSRVAREIRYLTESTPLISECDRPRIVAFANALGACDLFFGDLPGYAPVRAIAAPTDSIDPRSAWIDARLAFAESPALSQALGGALTQSALPLRVEPKWWLLAYIRGSLWGSNERTLASSNGTFRWLHVPAAVTSVRCSGLCELVVESPAAPPPSVAPPARTQPLQFRAIAPWLYVIDRRDALTVDALLRFNERYDPGWLGFASHHALRHVRVDASMNGWFLEGSSDSVVLVQITAVIQLIDEIVGACCVLYLLKALSRVPTKRAP